MSKCHYFFAGGGTGGHIYPGIAVAEQIKRLEPEARIHFFCSDRPADSEILSQSGAEFTALPAKAFDARLDKLISFVSSMCKSYRMAGKIIASRKPAVLLGIGGFASAPAVYAAQRLAVPVALLNTDAVPGRANKILARFATQIFVQFEDTAKYFAKAKAKVLVTGCPLRSRFANPDRLAAMQSLELNENKKTLLITGGSSGAQSINKAVCLLLERLARFSNDWQVVHLAGRANFESVKHKYENAAIAHKVLDYYDNMPDLLAAADLVIGRSGAVSVAEYAAAGVPSICLPYPYHKDKQQQLNANQLAEVGCAVIVNDTGESGTTTEELAKRLEELMSDYEKRATMARACERIARLDAAAKIAEELINRGGQEAFRTGWLKIKT